MGVQSVIALEGTENHSNKFLLVIQSMDGLPRRDSYKSVRTSIQPKG